jgi:flagellin
MVERLNNATGALDALRFLKAANRDVVGAQSRLGSGLRVQSAKDDTSAFHTASIMRSEMEGLKSVESSLSRAEGVVSVGLTAGEKISDLLREIRTVAVAASADDLSADQRQVYSDQYAILVEQIDTIVSSAEFDRANLINGSRPDGIDFIADASASETLSLKGRDFRPGGPVLSIVPTMNMSSVTAATEIANEAFASIERLGASLQDMAGEAKKVEAHIGFVSRFADALASGVGRMVDADLAAESALLQALQVKQSLGAESLSIANRAPQALLALFRS